MELIHDDRVDPFDPSLVLLQKPVKQNLSDDNQDRGVGIYFSIASDQPDGACWIPPTDGCRLQLLELLVGKCDQGGGVEAFAPRTEGFVNGPLGDQGFSGARRSAYQDALIR